jgi:hypothetical protein
MPLVYAFGKWSDSLAKVNPEDSRRTKWIACTSHRKLLESQKPEELQPDGSVQSSLKEGEDQDKHLMFVVEVANSQSLTVVRQKIGKWIFVHGVRTGMIMKVDFKLQSSAHDVLVLHFEMWRVREVELALFNLFGLEGKPIKEDSDIWYDEEMGFMWIPPSGQGDSVVYATLSQSGGPYEVEKVRNPCTNMNRMFISARHQIR